jgi:hypothetical protein
MQLSSIPFDYGGELYKPLYTEEEFQAKRQQTIQEFAEDGIDGWDPVGDPPEFLKGRWTRRGWSGTRFCFFWISGSTRPWLPRWYTGHDERCNPWLTVILPLFLGEISVRTNGEQRTYFSPPDIKCFQDVGFPRCPLDHDYHWPHCLPLEMECPWCRGKFPSTTGYGPGKDRPEDNDMYCSKACANWDPATLPWNREEQ